MKICIWTTSLQADTLALAIAIDRDPSIDLIIVAQNIAAYTNEPVAKALPLNCLLLDRNDDSWQSKVSAFNADIFLADNHLPKVPVGKKLLFHWHGVPLKIRPPRDIRSFHRNCKRVVGSAKSPNPNFIAQCYGQMDYDHRIQHWRLDKDNCRIWGSAYSDLLINPPYNREDLCEYYDLDVSGRKNILLSLTWNFGDRAFGILGEDDELFDRLFAVGEEYDANIIFSMHDRFRYSPELLAKIQHYASRYPRSSLKFKNEHADNLADLVVSDVMVCNFSSFIVFHYFTGKPSIHIPPIDTSKKFIRLPTLKKKRLASVLRRNNHKLWIYPFSDCGGSLPSTPEQFIDDLCNSLDDPGYLSDPAGQFITDKVFQPDGHTCQRIINDLKNW